MEKKTEPSVTHEKVAKEKAQPKKGETVTDRIVREVLARASVSMPTLSPQPIKRPAENRSRGVKRSRRSQEPVVMDVSKKTGILRPVKTTQ